MGDNAEEQENALSSKKKVMSKMTTRGGKKKRKGEEPLPTAATSIDAPRASTGPPDDQHVVAPPQKVVVKKKRGPTIGLKADKGPPVKPVDFNHLLEPTGGFKSDLKSYLLNMVKSQCDINHRWNQVSKKTKLIMFDRAQAKFQIPEDATLRDKVIYAMGKQFRDYKHGLTTSYIFPKNKGKRTEKKREVMGVFDDENQDECGQWDEGLEEDENEEEMEGGDEGDVILPYEASQPWKVYKGLTEAQWKEFYYSHVTPEFQEYRKKQRANSLKNKHSHYLGGKSIAQREKEWEAEGLLPPLTEPSSSVYSDRRLNSWMLSRTKKDKETGERYFPNECSSQVYQTAEKLTKEATEGIWSPLRHDDPLSRALGKPAHPGRVTGFGGQVRIRDVFGKPSSTGRSSQGMMSVDEHLKITKEITEKLKEEWMSEAIAKFRSEFFGKSSGASHDDMDSPGVRSSVHSVDPFPYANLEKPTNCTLLLSLDTGDVEVAWGQLLTSKAGDVVHGIPLQPNHSKVQINEYVPEHENCQLPVPHPPEHITVKSAHLSFIQWPNRLISLGQTKTGHASKKQVAPEKAKKKIAKKLQPDDDLFRENLVDDNVLSQMTTHMRLLHDYLISLPSESQSITFHLSETIIHKSGGIDVSLWVEEIVRVFRRSTVDLCVIQSYILFLSDMMNKYDVDSCAFLCPANCSFTNFSTNHKAFTSYVSHAVGECINKSYIMLPYVQEDHWVLIIICMKRHRIILYDSLGNTNEKPIKIRPLLNSGVMAALRKNKVTLKSNSVPWGRYPGPVQNGGTECAYFVMKFMHDVIVASVQTYDTTMDAALKQTVGDYNKSEVIDQMLDEWAEFIVQQSRKSSIMDLSSFDS